jgi:tetratricopeptide (TPR) repeat protein
VPKEVLLSARTALELLDGVADAVPLEHGRAVAATAWSEAVAGDPRRARQLLDELDALPGDEATDDILVCDLEQAHLLALMREGRFREAFPHVVRAGEAADRSGRPDRSYGPWINGAGAAMCAGDFEQALAFADRGLTTVRGRWLPMCEVHARAARITVLIRTGRLEDARTDADAALQIAERVDDPGLRGIALEGSAMVALAAGDNEQAVTALGAALASGAPVSRPLLRLSRAEALVRLDRLDEAEVELRKTTLEPVGPADMPDTLVPRLTRLQGLIAARRGDPALAQRRLAEAAEGWRRVARSGGGGARPTAALADLGRPGLGFVEPERELAQIEVELSTLQRATA